jgi:hypothetical protein
MGQDRQTQTSLGETLRQVALTAPRVEALLARYFPASGGCLYPDAAGNVCVAPGSGLAADRPASVYARCVAKLGPLVAAFSAAAMDQAASACIRLAKERTVFACALDFARHPLDPMQRQLFVARMMPQPVPLFRQDDATASCIWLRLWTLHAWLLELRLAIALSGGASLAEQAMLAGLDRDFAGLLRPDAQWLSVDLGAAAPAEMVARAPVEVLAVGTLLWPTLLGAMLPEGEPCRHRLRRAGMGIRHEDGRTWLSFGTRCAHMPSGKDSRLARLREMHLGA